MKDLCIFFLSSIPYLGIEKGLLLIWYMVGRLSYCLLQKIRLIYRNPIIYLHLHCFFLYLSSFKDYIREDHLKLQNERAHLFLRNDVLVNLYMVYYYELFGIIWKSILNDMNHEQA